MKKNNKNSSKSWLNQAEEGKLVIDVFQTPRYFIIQSPIAGLEDKDFDISIDNDLLHIQGNRPRPEIDKDSKYIYQECYWGKFSRQITLPDNIDTDRIKAALEKGILTIKIPKISKTSAKKIKIS